LPAIRPLPPLAAGRRRRRGRPPPGGVAAVPRRPDAIPSALLKKPMRSSKCNLAAREVRPRDSAGRAPATTPGSLRLPSWDVEDRCLPRSRRRSAPAHQHCSPPTRLPTGSGCSDFTCLAARTQSLARARAVLNSRQVFVTEIRELCDPGKALRALSVAALRAGMEGVRLHTPRLSAASICRRGSRST
jgi:hypothetical protein